MRKRILKAAREVGIKEKGTIGTYFHVDDSSEIFCKENLLEFSHLEDGGYMIKSLPNVKIRSPVQACFLITKDGFKQNVYNEIISEENSELHIIVGCTSLRGTNYGFHMSNTKIRVKKNSKLSLTMIHRWGEEFEVKPNTHVTIENGGYFICNFVSLHGAKILRMMADVGCRKNAVVKFNTVMLANLNSKLDIETEIYLEGKKSKAEILSKGVSRGGEIINKAKLIGKAGGVSGHLDCRGLMLSNEGKIVAVPQLDAENIDAKLTHEAAIGRIAEEEIFYLMTRGLSEDEAVSMIVRGFLNIENGDLPSEIKRETDRLVEKAIL